VIHARRLVDLKVLVLLSGTPDAWKRGALPADTHISYDHVADTFIRVNALVPQIFKTVPVQEEAAIRT
jgi:hypothetical protein